jgi:uncharacterized protein (DUF1501 family)
MLTINGQATRTCDGITRRAFLRVGALGAWTLPELLAARAASGKTGSDTAAIVIWCNGGPTQFETYDPKPDAPEEYRGEFKPIATSVPGIRICEALPRQAKLMHRLALVRSCAHTESGHGSATKNLLSGYPHPPNTNEGTLLYPSIGSVVAKVRENEARSLPPYVCVPSIDIRGGGSGDTGAAYLGAAYNPYGVHPKDGPKTLQLPSELTAERLQNRKNLLATFDRLRRAVDATGLMDGMDTFTRQAFEMVTGKAARDAMDLGLEPAGSREKYGTTVERGFSWGQGCLLARRLVEAGVSFVTVHLGGWDDHGKVADAMKRRAAAFDSAVSALVEDLYERGLDRRVTVVLLGEFGRTPRVNKNGGRDHWPSSMSVLLAGGGLKVGQVIGATNAKGERPKDRKLHPNDVWATVYRNLGIDPTQTFTNNAGRPVPILPHGEAIAELL